MWRWKYPQLRQGLVGAWCPSRDAARGTVRLTDQSLYRNHGTLTNMTADDWVLSPGAGGGYALDFDGSDDYVEIGDKPIVRFSDAFTLSIWVRTVDAGYQYLIQKWGQAGGTDSYHLRLDPTGFVALTTSTSGSYQAARDVTGTIAVNDATWRSVVATYDAVYSRVYVDGRLDGTTATTGSLYNASMPLRIGALSDGTLSSNWLTGRADDIRVYSRCLTPSEIAQLYRLGRGGAYALEYVSIGKAGGAAPVTRNDNLLLLGVS